MTTGAAERSSRLSWLARALHDPELECGAFEFGGDATLEVLERERAGAPPGELASDYRRIFGHTPGGACPLYELSWLKAGDFAAEQELADIGGFYRAFGVALSARERMDHVAVELEFLAYLAHLEARAAEEGREEPREVARQAQRSFLRDHLGRWTPALFERMEARAPEGFYRRLALRARAELDRLCREIDVRPHVSLGEPAGAVPLVASEGAEEVMLP
jgi:TorA maturation chaperone TorD